MNQPKQTTPLRRIAHLDMDAFYASVELLRYPQLKGLPVVIGGARQSEDDALAAAHGGRLEQIPVAAFARLSGYVGRGVITTATYPARQFGIGSAMGMMKAAKMCPEAILLPVDFARYRQYSRQFKAIVTSMAPQMEDRGVDEVYIDFTDVPGGQEEGGRVLAQALQRAIFEATGLTCSIGVAPNKQLAKLASEFNKPHGISIVMQQDLAQLIWPVPCRKLNGIGPKADAKLAALGLHTIGDISRQSREWLLQYFGKSYGAWLHDSSWGRDERPVVTESEPVSMSRETTFDRDLHAVRDKAELGRVFTELCAQVAADLQRKGYVGRTIGVKLRYADFHIATRDHSLQLYTNDAQAIRYAAGQSLKRAPLQQRLRLLGVRVGNLLPQADAVEQGLVADAAHLHEGEARHTAPRHAARDPFTLPLFDEK